VEWLSYTDRLGAPAVVGSSARPPYLVNLQLATCEFCLLVVTCSLSRLWRRTFFFIQVSRLLSARRRHVASSPLPSAQACLNKI